MRGLKVSKEGPKFSVENLHRRAIIKTPLTALRKPAADSVTNLRTEFKKKFMSRPTSRSAKKVVVLSKAHSRAQSNIPSLEDIASFNHDLFQSRINERRNQSSNYIQDSKKNGELRLATLTNLHSKTEENHSKDKKSSIKGAFQNKYSLPQISLANAGQSSERINSKQKNLATLSIIFSASYCWTSDPSLPKLTFASNMIGVKSTSEVLDFRPKYYNASLKYLPANSDTRNLREEAVYNHFLKSSADMVMMQGDELLDPEQYRKRLALRISSMDPETAMFPSRPSDSKLLVLDLDETLIHFSSDENKAKYLQHQALYVSPTKKEIILRFNVRPHIEEFLQSMSQHYEICVFTASDMTYAKTMVNYIDPERKYIKRIFDRRYCCLTKRGYVVKDLRIFGREYKLSNILLVDNSTYCFMPQIGNGVPIVSFERNMKDKELLNLKEYLLKTASQNDPVDYNRRHFRLSQYSQFDSRRDLITNLMN